MFGGREKFGKKVAFRSKIEGISVRRVTGIKQRIAVMMFLE
jgi:hypothetical protein